MLSHVVTVCLALLPFAQCTQIHHLMTREEVRKTFQTGLDNVPDYEVVRIYHTLHERDISDNSSRIVHFKAFNRHTSLHLEPYPRLLTTATPLVYTVGKNYRVEAFDNIGQPYHDVSKRSAIIAYEGEDGETLFQGNLLEDLSVVPVPPRLHDIILRETRDLEDFLPEGVDGEADFRRSHHHVVFKRRESDMKAINDYISVAKRERRSSGATAVDRSKRSIPSIVYPEIMVVVDFSLYEALGSDELYAPRYVLAFWLAVDLRYRSLDEPIVRLNIAGLVISLDPDVTPYLENKQDLLLTLKYMSQYFYKPPPEVGNITYDLAVAMTYLDICRVKNGACSSTYMRGACNRNDVRQMSLSVAIIKDNSGYSGIIIAAQALAHLMGVPSDGGPKTADCPDADGYLMAPSQIYGENRFQWSECSIKYFHDFLSAPRSSCLRNKPNPSKMPPPQLPGRLMTPDEQCGKLMFGSEACNNGPEVCTALDCSVPGTRRCITYSAAAEGSVCGIEMYCINGYCVSTNVTEVPYKPRTKTGQRVPSAK